MNKIRIPANVAMLADVEIKSASIKNDPDLKNIILNYYSNLANKTVKNASLAINELLKFLKDFSEVKKKVYKKGVDVITVTLYCKLKNIDDYDNLNSNNAIYKFIQKHSHFQYMYLRNETHNIFYPTTMLTYVKEYDKKNNTFNVEVHILTPTEQ